MFLVGMGLNDNPMRGKGRTAVTVSLASMLLPFGLGCLLALHLVTRYPAVHHLGFVLFMGAAMSVTAFPVLARILSDHGLIRTPLGELSLSCAAISDVIAWATLAVVVTLLGGNGRPQWLIVFVIPFVLVMFLVVRPFLERWFRASRGDGQRRIFPVALTGLLVSGALTEWMGLHFIFGAFLFGVIMPGEGTGSAPAKLRESMERIGGVLLLPVYFVIAGLKVDLSAMNLASVGDLVLILLVAVGGKFGGTYLAARASKVDSRDATALAILMNTRGLTELVILTVGLQLGVLNRELYSLMVVMALLTTAMAGPLLRRLYPSKRIHEVILQTAGKAGTVVAEGGPDNASHDGSDNGTTMPDAPGPARRPDPGGSGISQF
ncbi:Kef-type K+ transport system membrane component KefB [Saccharopolyspora phatthalungensis]|uniref:Kef-type K+ transport system membrane component KefB n=2 Tax=Saccharopolyspora phatthalungensis TaxID=664693 RepID=A0A840QFV1_9PSEU|nr:Kef-type K+ transport system membrane component KefB [Saccharopolyspora phatthalungensis]